ncbi:MAG: HRDC domain-containing protein, partial [Muribaculum sp.]|nr:HRDC domain-containing protein [Muribaculum sp.]
VIRQAVIGGYLSKDIENFGVLHVTPKGKKYYQHPSSFKITEDKEYNDDECEAPAKGGASCAVDPELFNILKDLRRKLAKHYNLPPYVIFQDPSLEAMATTYPITIEELQNIPGVGAGKAKRYGEEFVKVIKTHVIDNEIERPEDLRVRSVANKSKLKISIVQAIDRQIPLDTLAESKGLDFNELLDEVEAIVYAGTKININYFINDVMDEDRQEDIFEYFRESESDDIEEAVNELGGDYSEEEIRLVRIKFLSELAN